MHIRPSRLALGNTNRDLGGDAVAAPVGTVGEPRCPATPSARSFGRSLPPPAGPGQPSLGPLRLNSAPSLRIKSGLPRPRQTFYPCRCHTHVDARKHTLHGDAAGCSSHESSHGSHAGPAGSITVSDGNCLGERAPSRLTCIGR